MATEATSTAEPTVAWGLKRMILNAASYMSPRASAAAAASRRACGRRRACRRRARPDGGPGPAAVRTDAAYGAAGRLPGGGGCCPGDPGRRDDCSVTRIPRARECGQSCQVRSARRPGTGVPGPWTVRFGAVRRISAKIVRLLRRVPPDRVTDAAALDSLNRVSRDRSQCVCVRRTGSGRLAGDPISPTNPSGATRNTSRSRSRVARTPATRPTAGVGGGGGATGGTASPEDRVVKQTRTRYAPGGVRDR